MRSAPCGLVWLLLIASVCNAQGTDGISEVSVDHAKRLAQRVLSTLYSRIGIDPSQSFLSRAGRTMSITEDREPIPELVG